MPSWLLPACCFPPSSPVYAYCFDSFFANLLPVVFVQLCCTSFCPFSLLLCTPVAYHFTLCCAVLPIVPCCSLFLRCVLPMPVISAFVLALPVVSTLCHALVPSVRCPAALCLALQISGEPCSRDFKGHWCGLVLACCLLSFAH